MRLPELRFTVRRMMAAVAVTAYGAAVASQARRVCWVSPECTTPRETLLAVCAAGTFGVWAMRHPRLCLPVTVALLGWTEVPRLGELSCWPDYSEIEPDRLFAQGTLVAWAVGAPAGWLTRQVGRRRYPTTAVANPPPQAERTPSCASDEVSNDFTNDSGIWSG